MRQTIEYFDDREPALVHIAGTLRGALKIERLLDEQGVDYYVETDKYISGFLFATEKTGAFFYVAVEGAAECRALLERNRISVVSEDEARKYR